MKRRINVILIAAAGLAAAFTANAGEIGHFNGGLMNIRDYIMPDPGLYTAIYNYFYMTNQLNNSNGDAIKSVIIKTGPGSGIKLGVDVGVHLYALVPSLIWVTEVKPLGIKYGALISPSFVNANLNAELEALRGRGGSVGTGSLGLGDLFVMVQLLSQPLVAKNLDQAPLEPSLAKTQRERPGR
jgi:hypothetical protein